VRRYRVTVDGRTYEVEIDNPRARPVTARVLGEVFRVDVDAGGAQPSAAAGTVLEKPSGASRPAVLPTVATSASPGPGQLTAPIPGVITNVAATAGQVVQRGDELLTIEAMKMFNVIRSPWAGTVTAVHVTEGKPVTQGQLLLTFTLS
jgi:biotin carboxyl carrier protein